MMNYYSRTKKPERLYQTRFDESFNPTLPIEVTPEGFRGLSLEEAMDRNLAVSRVSRFVREVAEEIVIRSDDDAAQYLLTRIYTPFEDFDQEELWVLLLNSKNRVTHETMIYRGTVNSVSVRPAELLKEAVRVNAPMVIVSHCHPSGSPEPSPEDINVTKVAKIAAEMLNIDLLDHIIVGKDCWASLKSRGLF